MITVLVSQEEKYNVSSSKIKKELSEFLRGHGVTDATEVSVAIVGEKTMQSISNEFLKDNAIHDVLSFPSSEAKGEFRESEDGVKRLGDIVVCFEIAKEEAKEDGVSVERKVLDLVLHGALHLMGIHHS